MGVNRLTLPLAAAVILTAAASQATLARSADPTRAAQICVEQGEDNDLREFSRCWIGKMMSDEQRRIVGCFARNRGPGGTAFCVGGRQLAPRELRVAGCAVNSGGDVRVVADCAGMRALPQAAQRLADCVAANPQNVWGAALCAGGRDLAPELASFANCAVTTGLQPHAMAACVGGQVTSNELRKCLIVGIGGDGCFGDDKPVTDLVRRSWRSAAGTQAILADRPGADRSQVFGGSSSAFNEPGQLTEVPETPANAPGRVIRSVHF